MSAAPSEASSDGLISNAGALLGGRLVVAALGWAGSILIVRQLSGEEFGRFAFIFSVLGMLSIVTDMGIGRIAVSGVLGRPDEAGGFVGSYVLLRSVLGVLGYVIAVGFVVLLGYPDEVVQAMAVAAVVVLIATPAHALGIVFQARLQMQWVAVANTVGQVAQFSLTAAIAASGGSLLLFTVPPILCELINLAIIAPRAHRILPIRYRVQLRQWGSLLREALPLSIGAAFATLTYRIDSVMLAQLDDFVAVGRYNIAYKFADLLHFVSSAVAAPMMTILVAAYPGRPEDFRGALRRASTMLALLAGLALAGFALYAAELIELLYGAEYAEGATATVVLVAAQAFGYATSLAFVVLAATSHHRAYPWVAGTGLLVNVGLNAVLIPRWSFDGAAVATLVTEMLVLVALTALMLRIPYVRPLPLAALPRVAVAALGAYGVGFVLDGVVPWAVGGVLVAVAFVGFARATGALDPADLRGRP